MFNISSLKQRGIYHDLINEFVDNKHSVFIVTPTERRHKKKTFLLQEGNASLLNVRTLNLTKTSILEKGIGQILVERQFLSAIRKYYNNITFDLILYSTPPITFSKVISYIKNRDNAYSYLLLKDIFPQNAVDMKMMKKGSLLHKYFLSKEKDLYNISNTIGCMSEANKAFVLKNNPYLSAKKVEVNPNSIKPLFINYNDEQKRKIKNKYKIPLDKKIFVYGGNLGIPQGVDFLLETIENLKEPMAHILIVGNGTQFKKIKNWFTKNKPKNATLISSLPKNEYDALLAACDIGMIFLHKDFTIPNFPSRLLAYLEMKKPVLAATDNNTDLGEIIEKEKCGFWVASGETNAIQKKITKLCNSNLQQIGQNGWHLLERDYLVKNSYDLIINKIINQKLN